MVTILHWTGLIEDVPEDEARVAVNGGLAWLLSAYETAMVDPPREVAAVQPARPKRAYAQRQRRNPDAV